MSSSEIAIIGAGLSGLTLALALHQQGMERVTVYESRPAPLNIGGAVMLSPNALKITNALGFYGTIKSNGYNFELLDFKTPSGELIDTYEFGSETKYGYKANRIYRHELIDAVLEKVRDAGIAVKYGHKFSHVVEETDSGVTFAFTDGSQHTVSAVVGADGIHSTVRKYIYPDLQPKFTHMAGITAAVPTSQIKLPEPITHPLTIMHPQYGAFVIAPQKVDGSEVLIGKQKRIADEPTREGWDAIHADKDAAVAFLQQNSDIFGEIAATASATIPHNKINVWPFYVIPKLDKWASEKDRVIILGDAAHAIPPSAGQGINQAFEDVYLFALLVGARMRQPEKVKGGAAMAFWQKYRQDRIERVLELNKQIDARRAPVQSEADKELASKSFDLAWLYEVDFEAVVREWVESQ